MMTNIETKKEILDCVTKALETKVRLFKIAEVVGLPVRTLQRWKLDLVDKRTTVKHSSPKALTEKEKDLIVEICNRHEFKDMTPNKIVPKLVEQDVYIASESMFYRVLKDRSLLKHRSNCKSPREKVKPETLIATAPNQILSWDITYIKSGIRGIFFYLYLFMDVYSRKIMGWQIENEESGSHAQAVISRICRENNLTDILLHADNGGPMKCGNMLSTLQFLGVTASFSRPAVSNDNPYSEALFKTLKYKAGYPKSFDSIEEARDWVEKFVHWYNNEHQHSSIKYVTPEQRHRGEDANILLKRQQTYEEAKKKNPLRWTGKTRDWSYVNKVELRGSAKKIEPKKNT
jgi:putative transposase